MPAWMMGTARIPLALRLAMTVVFGAVAPMFSTVSCRSRSSGRSIASPPVSKTPRSHAADVHQCHQLLRTRRDDGLIPVEVVQEVLLLHSIAVEDEPHGTPVALYRPRSAAA